MIYITGKASPRYRQMSIEDYLSDGEFSSKPVVLNEYNTRTVTVERLNDKYRYLANPRAKINALKAFNRNWDALRSVPRHDLYDSFKIPKKSGGLRQINAPVGELKAALYELKALFEAMFDARWLFHTNAFAYIEHRCTIDALKKHQQNDSRWFLKLDLHNFFGSTTLDFAMKQFAMVYPFSEVVRDEEGSTELRKALELAFLDGGLPQGTPISPMITNIMMIPIDHTLAKSFANFNSNAYVYTRYADDFIISSRYSFCFRDVEKHVVDVLASFDAPFSINHEKTRYGSRNGKNWNLGLMLNKNNDITIGKEKKRNFRVMLHTYASDRAVGKRWPIDDVQTLDGLRNYYRMVEGEEIDKIVCSVGKKLNVDIVKAIREDLSI